jgi:hypothetical protein
MQAVISEVEIPDHGTVVMVGVGEIRGARQCPPLHAVQAMELLADHALSLAPDLANRSATHAPFAELMNRLWPATRSCLRSLLQLESCSHLRQLLDMEVERRVSEELALSRDAARQRGLKEAKEVVARLVAICGEGSADVRNLLLAEFMPEIRRSFGDLGTTIR